MILVGKPEGNRLEILRRRLEDNIKIDLKEMGLGRMRIGLMWLSEGASGGLL